MMIMINYDGAAISSPISRRGNTRLHQFPVSLALLQLCHTYMSPIDTGVDRLSKALEKAKKQKSKKQKKEEPGGSRCCTPEYTGNRCM